MVVFRYNTKMETTFFTFAIVCILGAVLFDAFLYKRFTRYQVVYRAKEESVPLQMDHPFLFGVSTAPFQNEVRVHQAPPSLWRQFVLDKVPEKDRLDSPQHWDAQTFSQDVERVKKEQVNSVRIGIDWARVFPTPGEPDATAVQTYRGMLATLCRFDMSIMVTLHHFVEPLWFSELGSFAKEENIAHYLDFVGVCMDICNVVPQECTMYFLTFNEPFLYAMHGWGIGIDLRSEKATRKRWR